MSYMMVWLLDFSEWKSISVNTLWGTARMMAS